MKLLFIMPYIYAPEFAEHSKNGSGFGMMVNDIAASVGASGNDVICVTHTFGPRRECNGFSIVANSPLKNIFYGRYKGILKRNKALKKEGLSFKGRLRELYFHLNLGYVEHLMKKEKPDVVHLHGCSDAFEYAEICRKNNVPFVVTLHGLLENDDFATEQIKAYERELVKCSYSKNIPITVISSKMKDIILSPYYGAENNENVVVVTNGVDVNAKEPTVDIREKLGIGKEKKIILSVGSVCNRKNQMQTVRAFSLMSDEEKQKTVLIFAGSVYEDYKIVEEIERLGLGDKVFILGFVPREDLKNYYSVADIVVMASISEGFGLSIVEGFSYGIPCATFDDLDAISDVFDESAMLLCKDRSDEAFSEALSKALNTSWDKAKIVEHSKKFSLEAMAEKYNEVYKYLLKK